MCTPYVKFKYIFQFLTPTSPIQYATFIGLRWRISCVLSVTSNVKDQIEQKNFVQKFVKFWPFRGPDDQGVWKVVIFTAKVSSLRECTSFEPFCVKIGWVVWPPEVNRKKSQKFTRGSHRNDVSPLIQARSLWYLLVVLTFNADEI